MFRGGIVKGHNLIMNDSGKRDHPSKLFNARMAIVEVGRAETNEEAWLRHLTTHPEDHNINVRIFNRQKPGIEKDSGGR